MPNIMVNNKMIPKAHASDTDCWHAKYLTNTQHISLRKKIN